MTWRPSEGARRAGDLVCDLTRESHDNGMPIHYLMLVRMQEVISKAIDQALRDGSEMDALASVVGNGTDPTLTLANKVYGAPGGPHETLAAAFEALSPIVQEPTTKDFTATPKKRGRGRPKGSTKAKKKAKEAPQAEPTDMQP